MKSHTALAQTASLAQKDLAKLWSDIEQEMYGHDQLQKDYLRKAALADERVTPSGQRLA